MMFSSMVGVEILHNVANTNERVDVLSLETSELIGKVQVNLNKVDQVVGEVDHQVEILEESCCHYQGFLEAHQAHQVSYN